MRKLVHGLEAGPWEGHRNSSRMRPGLRFTPVGSEHPNESGYEGSLMGLNFVLSDNSRTKLSGPKAKLPAASQFRV